MTFDDYSKNGPVPADHPSGQRLWVEDEFWEGELAVGLGPEGQAQKVGHFGPADYPRLSAGELLLTRHQGDFIKPCPATLNYNCCGLTIFHFGLGCTLGCRYCILSAYLGTEALILFGNIEDGLKDLEERLAKIKNNGRQTDRVDRPCKVDKTGRALPAGFSSRRYCTGEFTDSLLLDKKTFLAGRLIKLFAGYNSAVLELKTKTDYVDHLLKLDHQGHTIISFSVNAPEICAEEESKAAPLRARLSAAARAAGAGYPIGLHFDPLILHPGWEEGYSRTIELIGEYLKGAQVAWVSMGCFRYLPSLKEVMLNRHPETSIYNGEFIMGGDGKMRYPRPIRTMMYKFLLSGLRRVLPAAAVVYMCMESPRLWRDVFGCDPETEGLTGLLDRRAEELLQVREIELPQNASGSGFFIQE